MTLAEEMKQIATKVCLEQASSYEDHYQKLVALIEKAANKGERAVYFEVDRFQAPERRFEPGKPDQYMARSMDAYKIINLLRVRAEEDGFKTKLADGLSQDHVWNYGLDISW